MAIKPPVKTIEEAFNSSCKKNGIKVRKKTISRRSMLIRDEKGDEYILSEDLSFKKKAGINPTKKRGYVGLKSNVGRPEVVVHASKGPSPKRKLVSSKKNIAAAKKMIEVKA